MTEGEVVYLGIPGVLIMTLFKGRKMATNGMKVDKLRSVGEKQFVYSQRPFN